MLFANDVGVCPNCGLASSFEHKQSIFSAWPKHDPNAFDGSQPSVSVKVLRCRYCSRSAVVLDRRDPSRGDEEGGGPKIVSRRLICPEQKPRSLPESVPDEVRDLYEEASTCEQAGALRGAGVLYRAAAEALVKDRQAEGRDLYARIEDLKNRGASDELVDDLHEARLLGNFSIHDGVTFAPEEIADVADLLAEACVVLYVQPAERAAMRAARKVKREGVK